MLSDNKDNESLQPQPRSVTFFFFNMVQRRKGNLQVSGQNIFLLLLVFVFIYLCTCLLVFSGAAPVAYGVSRLGVQSEL